MSAAITITRAGPLATLQDAGRFGMLRHGISASGPMDRRGWRAGGAALGRVGATGIEFTSAGIGFRVEHGPLQAAGAGGSFAVNVNGHQRDWPARLGLAAGDVVEITPGGGGNYGYLRFDREIDVPAVLGSRSTNLVVGLGGFEGRALRAGDRIGFGAEGGAPEAELPAPLADDAPLRIVWGLHADLFGPEARQGLLEAEFRITPRLDRMGVRLSDEARVFAGEQPLGLVSDAIVPGDIQILGDGQPIVLMRDHQPTGGYPRIATLIGADLDRFAQLRPGSPLRFAAIGQAAANAAYRATFG